MSTKNNFYSQTKLYIKDFSQWGCFYLKFKIMQKYGFLTDVVLINTTIISTRGVHVTF